MSVQIFEQTVSKMTLLEISQRKREVAKLLRELIEKADKNDLR